MTPRTKNLYTNIAILTTCIGGLVIIYIAKSSEGFKNSKQRRPFLYKERYTCNKPHLTPAFSPDICCRLVNGKLKCDNKRNCRCKNKKTGICESCYPYNSK